MSLKGRTALVGGASQGIGYAIARLLAARGCAGRDGRAQGQEPLARRPRARSRIETGSRTLRDRRRHPARRRLRRASSRRPSAGSAASTCSSTTTARRRSANWSRFRRRRLGARGRAEPDERRAADARRAARACAPAAGAASSTSRRCPALQPIPQFGLSVATWAGVIGYAKTLSLEVAADTASRCTRSARAASPRRASARCSAAAAGRGRRRQAGGDGAADSDAAHRQRRTRSPAWSRFSLRPGLRYMTGCVFHVDGGRRAGLL